MLFCFFHYSYLWPIPASFEVKAHSSYTPPESCSTETTPHHFLSTHTQDQHCVCSFWPMFSPYSCFSFSFFFHPLVLRCKTVQYNTKGSWPEWNPDMLSNPRQLVVLHSLDKSFHTSLENMNVFLCGSWHLKYPAIIIKWKGASKGSGVVPRCFSA